MVYTTITEPALMQNSTGNHHFSPGKPPTTTPAQDIWVAWRLCEGLGQFSVSWYADYNSGSRQDPGHRSQITRSWRYACGEA
jgi:hypothetical protein